MPRKTELTYFTARKCWKKRRQGRTYYVGPRGVSRGDRDAYAQALKEWSDIAAELDAADDAEHETEATRRLIEQHPADHLAADIARGMAPDDPRRDVAMAITGAGLRKRGLLHHPAFALPTQQDADSTIGHHLDRYLLTFRAAVELGQKSRGRYASHLAHLERFRGWTRSGGDTMGATPMTALRADLITDYHAHCAGLITSGEASPHYAHDLIGSVKQFIRWAWEEELIDLPRNLASKRTTINIPTRKPKHLTPDQVRTLYNAATDRTRLYIALAANCGMTQQDIADLKREEVDLNKGIITRRRSKTGHHKGTPTVAYRLWPSTLKLLRDQIAGAGELALITDDGKQLVRDWTRDDGTPSKVDVVRLAYRRLVSKVNRWAEKEAAKGKMKAPAAILPQFRILRATGANLIEQSQHKAASSLYLAHSPRSVKDRHYVNADQTALDAALGWLGDELDLTGTQTPTATTSGPETPHPAPAPTAA